MFTTKMFVRSFPSEIQQNIEKKVKESLFSEGLLNQENLENAMDSRLCDLGELVEYRDLQNFVCQANVLTEQYEHR